LPQTNVSPHPPPSSSDIEWMAIFRYGFQWLKHVACTCPKLRFGNCKGLMQYQMGTARGKGEDHICGIVPLGCKEKNLPVP